MHFLFLFLQALPFYIPYNGRVVSAHLGQNSQLVVGTKFEYVQALLNSAPWFDLRIFNQKNGAHYIKGECFRTNENIRSAKRCSI